MNDLIFNDTTDDTINIFVGSGGEEDFIKVGIMRSQTPEAIDNDREASLIKKRANIAAVTIEDVNTTVTVITDEEGTGRETAFTGGGDHSPRGVKNAAASEAANEGPIKIEDGDETVTWTGDISERDVRVFARP